MLCFTTNCQKFNSYIASEGAMKNLNLDGMFQVAWVHKRVSLSVTYSLYQPQETTEAANAGVLQKAVVVLIFGKCKVKHLRQILFFNNVLDWGLQSN